MTTIKHNRPLRLALTDSCFVDDRPDVADRGEDESPVRHDHQEWNVIDLEEKPIF